MKARSDSGRWLEHSLPAWIDFASLVDARKRFQREQESKKCLLNYTARTAATHWILKNKPEWASRLGEGLDSLLVAYALCLGPKVIKLSETEL